MNHLHFFSAGWALGLPGAGGGCPRRPPAAHHRHLLLRSLHPEPRRQRHRRCGVLRDSLAARQAPPLCTTVLRVEVELHRDAGPCPLRLLQGAQSIGRDFGGGAGGGGGSDALEKWALVWSTTGVWFERELSTLITAAEKPRVPMASPGPVGALLLASPLLRTQHMLSSHSPQPAAGRAQPLGRFCP